MGSLDGRAADVRQMGEPATAPASSSPPLLPEDPNARHRAPWSQRPHPDRPPAGPSPQRRHRLRAGLDRRRRRARHVDHGRRRGDERTRRRLGASTCTSPRAPTACSRSCWTSRSRWRPRSTGCAATTRSLVAHIARTRELLAQPTAGPDDTRVLLALTGIAKLVDHHRRPRRRPAVPGVQRRSSPPGTDHPPINPGVGTPAIGQTVSVRVFRCFSFVDMCGFTRMNDTLGDDEALAVLAEFRAIVRGLSPDHGIRVGKWLGDGCMFVGTEVRPVVETVLDLTERMENASIVLPLRIGIAAGKRHRVRGRRLHRHVDQPRRPRLCDAAAPGEILANDEVVQALGDDVPRHPAGRAPDPRHRDPHPGVADRHARDGGRRAPAELRGVNVQRPMTDSFVVRAAVPLHGTVRVSGRDQERRHQADGRRAARAPAPRRCATSIPSPTST